jgi:hypothetical protein
MYIMYIVAGTCPIVKYIYISIYLVYHHSLTWQLLFGWLLVQFYWNETLAKTPGKGIFVIRQESLEKDLVSLEVHLGQSVKEASGILWHPPDSFHFVRGGAPSRLDRDATRNLCCAIRDELSIYHQLLERATNDLQKKQETLTQTYEICHFQSAQELESVCQKHQS